MRQNACIGFQINLVQELMVGAIALLGGQQKIIVIIACSMASLVRIEVNVCLLGAVGERNGSDFA